jgi:predicted nicotinamide N-methyase
LTQTTTMTVTTNEEDIQWTDASIRWPEDEVVSAKQKIDVTREGESDDDDEEENGTFDIFADQDPHEIFSFRFDVSEVAISSTNSSTATTTNNTIQLNIHGYKTESDEVWQSTGLTLWKASKYLCHYMCANADELRQGRRILELGAGLGLNGILAHRLAPDSTVVVTDGDSDAMTLLRKNIAVNRLVGSDKNETTTQSENSTIYSKQLIWGLDQSKKFLNESSSSSSSSSKFSVIIASDVIYAKIVIDPLFETIRTILSDDGVFWLAFAIRKVPVTIEFVLQKAREYGFCYELVQNSNKSDDEEEEEEGNNDDNIDGKNSKIDNNNEAGPVFIYVFRWDV